jgi:hypothetical protein
MDNKQLIKVVKALVEAEVAKKHELFLKNQFPKILDEAVQNKMKTLKNTTTKQVVREEVDPFELANQVLQNERQEQPTRHFTKNQALNEVLNQTQPFSAAQRSGGQVGGSGTSILDSLPQSPINENTHIPSYMDAEPDIEQTINMGSSLGTGGTDALRAQMAHKMGYGDMNPSGTNRGGLGVTTGLAGLDRILNRDNSELVKKFKR